jgi:tetratricopeptide (TPR) repeat protein
LIRWEEGSDGEARYQMLETIRDFGWERLENCGEAGDVRRRHAEWCLDLVERAEPELTGPAQRVWLERLESEHPNLRTALAASLDGDDGLVEIGARLAARCWLFWYMRGHLGEGRSWLERALAAERVSAPTRVLVTHALSWCAYHQGDRAAAVKMAEESLALAERLGDEGGIGRALLRRGVASQESDPDGAERDCERALSIFRAIDDSVWICFALGNLGVVMRRQGATDRARALFEELLTRYRSWGSERGMAIAFQDLADIALDTDDAVTAAATYRESLSLWRRLDDRYRIGECLDGLAAVAARDGRPERAARLLGAADRLREATGYALHPAFQRAHERSVELARTALGEAAFAAAWAAGRDLSLDAAIAEAEGPAPLRLGLTDRERESSACWQPNPTIASWPRPSSSVIAPCIATSRRSLPSWPSTTGPRPLPSVARRV